VSRSTALLALRAEALLRRLVLVIGLVLAPLALGPAFSPLVMALGGGPDHLCACGMKQGTCGCPECEQLASPDAHPTAPLTHAVLGSCDDHGRGSIAGGLPPCVVPASLAVLTYRSSRLVPVTQDPVVNAHSGGPPPTPPPRPLEADLA